MQIRPPDSNNNLAQVGIVNDDYELVKNQENVEQNLTAEIALNKFGNIPDVLNFTHNFAFKNDCCEKQEESTFTIEPIGELKLGGHVKYNCGNCCSCKGSGSCKGTCSCAQCLSLIPCVCCCDRCFKQCHCCPSYEAVHFYLIPSYILKNDTIRFEHFPTFAKLYIYDTLVLELELGYANISDVFCGSCKSNIPHIYFTNPLNQQNEKIYFEPLGNRCPVRPRACCYCCALCSFAGICDLERTIVAKVGENAEAKIIARRSQKNACLSQCGCQDFCCHFIDYPDFEMTFTNLSKIQKLGLIFSTISYTIFSRWEKYSYRGVFNFNYSFLDF
ncbi:unnamed protein product [Paramecium octaurelia]|uniref:Uncharacterized protein n=1 Tax=Paramecium octaurelia TaxID=43137 RepID=A0A8S1VIX6_PAROT|nr:unnamed protein product [Paramecium octaurelia]